MRGLILVLVSAVMFSSCASILNTRYQKVTINTKKKNEILVDGEKAKKKKGKYLLKRDGKPKQITVKREGFKDENTTLLQYKKSPLHIISWIPFGVLLYPPLYDVGDKAYNYDKEVTVGKKMVPSIPERDAKAKEIKLNRVSVNLNEDNFKYRNFRTYK